jgi:predicted RNA binding protein YcfA (HicA-like mRNA interferase family)
MPRGKLPVLSSREVLRALEKAGFRAVRQRGSHIILEGMEGRHTVVPRHHEIAPSTLLKILTEAGLTKDEFLDLL